MQKHENVFSESPHMGIGSHCIMGLMNANRSYIQFIIADMHCNIIEYIPFHNTNGNRKKIPVYIKILSVSIFLLCL